MSTPKKTKRPKTLAGVASLQADGGAKLSDRVGTELARRVVWGELGAGEQFPTEHEISDAFNVSRSVVRDAIRSLSTLGLISVQQGRGITVASPNAAAFGEALIILLMRSELTMGDVIEARATIETQLAPLAAERGTPEDWDRLDQSLKAFAAAVEAEDWAAAEQEHLEFHGGIIRSLHQPALELMLEPVHHVILLSSIPPQMDDPGLWEVWAHPPILDQLRAGDGTKVRESMVKHFQALQGPLYAEWRQTRFRESEAARRVFSDLIKHAHDAPEPGGNLSSRRTSS